ncbi:zwei Ig domain protein zig-8-like isoform X2 [Homalodisca vitripennis]|uniref:zwei Ig domain protein zig-8-like isoform X2 n=1 Tax=Homalodisca vitripennis TaxID=197043 RepID=UPI001EEC91A7|nr:zwei Ig domain protein zig-8-like isoform X2 [Homalodisca vitripennis]
MWPSSFLVSLFLTSSAIGYPWTEAPTTVPESHFLPQPYFEQTPSSVMVRPGQTVQIPCRVRNLGDKIVSWIRRRDLHILASAGLMFTADQRFKLLHPDGDSASWTLQLRAAQPQDQGLYECQVNTEPKMKQSVLLTVSDMVSDDAMELSMGDDASAVGTSRILGPREQYVKAGSTWTLTCEISGVPDIRIHNKPENFLAKPARLVDWLHEGRLLTYQSTRGGVNIDTEHIDGQTVTRLTLANLRNEDTGRYVCKPLALPPAVVTIIVIEGEKTAMLGKNVAADSISSSSLIVTLTALLAVLFLQH